MTEISFSARTNFFVFISPRNRKNARLLNDKECVKCMSVFFSHTHNTQDSHGGVSSRRRQIRRRMFRTTRTQRQDCLGLNQTKHTRLITRRRVHRLEMPHLRTCRRVRLCTRRRLRSHQSLYYPTIPTLPVVPAPLPETVMLLAGTWLSIFCIAFRKKLK